MAAWNPEPRGAYNVNLGGKGSSDPARCLASEAMDLPGGTEPRDGALGLGGGGGGNVSRKSQLPVLPGTERHLQTSLTVGASAGPGDV